MTGFKIRIFIQPYALRFLNNRLYTDKAIGLITRVSAACELTGEVIAKETMEMEI